LRVDDVATPYLWTDEEVMSYAVEAEDEACRRAHLLKDSSTAAICSISLGAGVNYATLDSRIIRIGRVMVSGQTLPLQKANMRDLDAQRPGWETATATRLEAVVTDWQTGMLRVYPTPISAVTISLSGVVRLPLTDMNDLEDTPEINARFHHSLVGYMIFKAFMKPDKQTYDQARAAVGLAEFEAEFGKKRSAQTEVWEEEQEQGDVYDGSYQ